MDRSWRLCRHDPVATDPDSSTAVRSRSLGPAAERGGRALWLRREVLAVNRMTDQTGEAQQRRFRPYPEYRDSGIEWLGEIPAHWQSKVLKRLFRVVNGSTPTSGEPDNWDGDIPWVTPDDLGKLSDPVLKRPARHLTRKGYESCGTHMVCAGSLILSTRAPIGHLAIAGTPICTNQGCRSLVLRSSGHETYFYFQLVAGNRVLEAKGRGSTFKELASQDLECFALSVPPPDEQRAIAEFLARETAKIDALVARKERLIELLQEKRTALITCAVTRGLDPNVPMKDSGVEWMGEVPAHWEMKRLWHLTPSERKIMYGIVLPGPDVEDGVPIVKGGDVAASRLKVETLSKTTFEIESSYTRSRLAGGDLVFAIRGSIGEVEMVPDELHGANLTQDAARVAYAGTTHGVWLLYALRSQAVFSQLEAGALGATIKGVNIRDLKRALIPVPPKREQERIGSFLSTETARFDTLSAKVRAAIEQFRELRAALIAAAVTGKVDVRVGAS